MTTLADLRKDYHREIACHLLGFRQSNRSTDVLSNADGSSSLSVRLAAGIAERINQPLCASVPDGQTLGAIFARVTSRFLEQAFGRLAHLRPGDWTFSMSQAAHGIAAYDQYEHLAALSNLARIHPELRGILGSDYLITPDIVIGRAPVSDATVNEAGALIPTEDAGQIAKQTPLRAANGIARGPMLHASISCKWTIRSDRAQNTRTEALNLIRNRKGRTPHIVVVTAEPLPRRLASIAIGTGDVDCTYHAALTELVGTLEDNSYEFEDALAEIRDLMSARRLRDISDLPFDLAI